MATASTRVAPPSRVAFSLNKGFRVPAAASQVRVTGPALQPQIPAATLSDRPPSDPRAREARALELHAARVARARQLGSQPVAPVAAARGLRSRTRVVADMPLPEARALPASAARGAAERREPARCAGDGAARLQAATAESAALRRENAALGARLRRTEALLAEAQQALQNATVSAPPPPAVESNTLFVRGLHVASGVTPPAQFMSLCRDDLHMLVAPVVEDVTVRGLNAHGLSSMTARMASVPEAKRVLGAARACLNSRDTVSVDWSRTRAQRVALKAARHTERLPARSAQAFLSQLAAVFHPDAQSHDITARTTALASASAPASASASASGRLAQE